MVQHQDVGLLDDLRAGHPLGAQHDVSRHRRWGDVGDEQRLEAEVAGELLVEALLRVIAVDQSVGQGAPGSRLGAIAAKIVDKLGGPAEVPAGITLV